MTVVVVVQTVLSPDELIGNSLLHILISWESKELLLTVLVVVLQMMLIRIFLEYL